MILAFTSLCTLDVTHAYYGGPCRDFAFVVPGDMARALGRGRLLARARDGRLHVLYEQADGGGPLVDLTGTTLRVALVLRNSGLANVTVPVAPAGMLAVYGNVTGGIAGPVLLPPRSVTPVGAVFSQPLTDPGRPATLTLTDARGRLAATDLVTADDPRSTVSFDLSGREPGGYVLVVDHPGGVQDTRALYFDGELAGQPAWAVVEITIATGFYTTPPSFTVSLTARTETLRYYVVAREHTLAEFAQLQVSDEGAADDGRPPVLFERLESSAFTPSEISPALLGNGDVRIALFRSTAAVARLARGRQRIQLSRNGEVLIPHLPQPGAERATADLIVHVSRKP
jgi:hypothetical protein